MRILLERLPDAALYIGDSAPNATVRVLSAEDLGSHQLHNCYLAREILVQRGYPWRKLARARIVLLDLNPRIPQNWITLIIRKAFRRPTVLWGHAWPRAGREAATGRLRHAMRVLASTIVTYTETEAVQLRELHPALTISSAPNALYPQSAISFDMDTVRRSFIYVGRFVAEKKPKLALRAFARLARSVPEIRLVMIGEGPEGPELEALARKFQLARRVSVLPYEDDLEQLRRHYSNAVASLSPGYVGLSAVQSFSFGVPLIVADREPHAPELEAVRIGFNSIFFRSDDERHLAQVMETVLTNHGTWFASGAEIAAACAAEYSTEAMAEGVARAVEGPMRGAK